VFFIFNPLPRPVHVCKNYIVQQVRCLDFGMLLYVAELGREGECEMGSGGWYGFRADKVPSKAPIDRLHRTAIGIGTGVGHQAQRHLGHVRRSSLAFVVSGRSSLGCRTWTCRSSRVRPMPILAFFYLRWL